MSAEAEGHVWRKSPYTGSLFAIHLAIGDSANDQHHYEFFMSNSSLAAKARVTRETANRAVKRMVADEWLSIVDDGPHLPRGIVRYRFEFQSEAEDAWAPRIRPVTRDHTSRPDEPSTYVERSHDPVTTGHTELNREPKPKTRSSRPSAEEAADPDKIVSFIQRAKADLRG